MNYLTNNIVLIGMPGCGKTTIGKMVSEKLKMDFIDLDEFIEKITGDSIKEIFKHGEEHFRNLESEAVCEVSKFKSTVISTGGGVIKKHINIEKLKENGLIIFIDRSIEDIASDVKISSRPLLKDGPQRLYELFDERYNLYNKYSDIIVKNNGEIEDIVEEIIKIYNNNIDI
ncbi:shikimate kinase [Clostridium polyendosporum]|uniref:Shikimate kinase n=1 Tax=Clostridium polyendosporum TaxID=69208 RepID=A0A919RZV5_9CLOT|nr:shikimate kinase [Clostridium polyendosporum]GIM29532.1 shikimate kinase [Clostridium polyendosporum]